MPKREPIVASTPSDDGGGGDGTFLEPFTATNVMEHRRPVSVAGAILTTHDGHTQEEKLVTDDTQLFPLYSYPYSSRNVQ